MTASHLFAAMAISQCLLLCDDARAASVKKLITWGDGTSETLEVDDTGHIFLNGTYVPTALSFVIHVDTPPGADNMLSWLEARGIRFMQLSIPTWAADPAGYVSLVMR